MKKRQNCPSRNLTKFGSANKVSAPNSTESRQERRGKKTTVWWSLSMSKYLSKTFVFSNVIITTIVGVTAHRVSAVIVVVVVAVFFVVAVMLLLLLFCC